MRAICAIFSLLCFLSAGTVLNAQMRCSVSDANSPVYEASSPVNTSEPVVIPVAVHVVWRNPEENISDAQIESQIEVLNKDYRKQNTEVPSIHPFFDDLASDTEVSFCLVAITRTSTDIAGITNTFSGGQRRLCFTDLGGRDGFDPEHYLNIWVAGRSDGALGSATFPEEGQLKPQEDGIYIRPDAFGTTGTVSPPFHLGRTCTHEVGHYFNLQHLWGPNQDNFNCNEDDGIDDTPLQASTYQGTCPTLPPMSCGSPDMYMNFMNLTQDACMALFTHGQKDRIFNTLQTYRPGLLKGSCTPVATNELPEQNAHHIRLFNNPAGELLRIVLPGNEMAQLTIFDSMGRLVLQTQAMGPIGECSLADIHTGNYYIKIRYENKIHVKKLIIAR